MMSYKGYLAHVQYDDSVNVFHGTVVNIGDVVTFEATTVDGLQKELRDSVEDYLEFCRERGEEPEKPFTGEFRLRLDPRFYRELFKAAQDEGESVDDFITKSLQRTLAVSTPVRPPRRSNRANPPKRTRRATAQRKA